MVAAEGQAAASRSQDLSPSTNIERTSQLMLCPPNQTRAWHAREYTNTGQHVKNCISTNSDDSFYVIRNRYGFVARGYKYYLLYSNQFSYQPTNPVQLKQSIYQQYQQLQISYSLVIGQSVNMWLPVLTMEFKINKIQRFHFIFIQLLHITQSKSFSMTSSRLIHDTTQQVARVGRTAKIMGDKIATRRLKLREITYNKYPRTHVQQWDFPLKATTGPGLHVHTGSGPCKQSSPHKLWRYVAELCNQQLQGKTTLIFPAENFL